MLVCTSSMFSLCRLRIFRRARFSGEPGLRAGTISISKLTTASYSWLFDWGIAKGLPSASNTEGRRLKRSAQRPVPLCSQRIAPWSPLSPPSSILVLLRLKSDFNLIFKFSRIRVLSAQPPGGTTTLRQALRLLFLLLLNRIFSDAILYPRP